MNRILERVYRGAVGVKGVDGLVEVLAGAILLMSPDLLRRLLDHVAQELSESQRTQVVADYVARMDLNVAQSGVVSLSVFLLSHGLVKLALVYCLLREILWAYPYALAILTAFLAYQIYVFARHPTVGMGLFCALDAVIIWLVWAEWRHLKAAAAGGRAEGSPGGG